MSIKHSEILIGIYFGLICYPHIVHAGENIKCSTFFDAKYFKEVRAAVDYIQDSKRMNGKILNLEIFDIAVEEEEEGTLTVHFLYNSRRRKEGPEGLGINVFVSEKDDSVIEIGPIIQ